jgi:hypothetical protein
MSSSEKKTPTDPDTSSLFKLIREGHRGLFRRKLSIPAAMVSCGFCAGRSQREKFWGRNEATEWPKSATPKPSVDKTPPAPPLAAPKIPIFMNSA